MNLIDVNTGVRFVSCERIGPTCGQGSVSGFKSLVFNLSYAPIEPGTLIGSIYIKKVPVAVFAQMTDGKIEIRSLNQKIVKMPEMSITLALQTGKITVTFAEKVIDLEMEFSCDYSYRTPMRDDGSLIKKKPQQLRSLDDDWMS